MGSDSSPLRQYRCSDCGYGASRRAAPERCPMCGGVAWHLDARATLPELAPDLVAAARWAALHVDVDAPLVRERREVSVFPGVPFS